jgi:curved DNA-binding protein CbpA
MIERRNFYRILHIQPDASFAVIRESYRVLMRAHESRSNLREADWDLGLLNIAYKTLQDPQLRATYNRELLKRYPIKTLSQGAFGISAEHAVYQTSEKRPRIGTDATTIEYSKFSPMRQAPQFQRLIGY